MTEFTQPVTRSVDITDSRLLSTQGITKVYPTTVNNLKYERIGLGFKLSYTMVSEIQRVSVSGLYVSDRELSDFAAKSDYTGGNNEDLLKAYILGL